MTKKEEIILLEELKKGNEKALATIIKLSRNDIFKSARLIVDNDQDAKDIQQQVFIRLWERRDTLKIKVDLKTYLKAAARNTALNYIKKAKYNSTKLQEVSIQQTITQSQHESEEPPEQKGNSPEETLMAALALIPERRASIFRQVVLEGKTPQMVADAEQIEESTVRSHLQKAGAQLKKLLTKKS